MCAFEKRVFHPTAVVTKSDYVRTRTIPQFQPVYSMSIALPTLVANKGRARFSARIDGQSGNYQGR
jgi:hypothetical protein